MNTQVNQNAKPASPVATEVKLKTLAELEKEYTAAKDELEKNDFADEFVKKVKSAKAAIDKFNQDKQANIANIKNTINGFGFTLTDIFSPKELNKAGYFESSNATATVAGNAPATTTEPKYVYPSDSNKKILEKKSNGTAGSRDWSLNEGRIFEMYKGKGKKVFGPSIPTTMKTFKSEKDVLALATEYGKQFFATEQGKKELAEILKVVKEATA